MVGKIEPLDELFEGKGSCGFEKITLAIGLLGGLLAFLLKLINYFNENIILLSDSTQMKAYFLVGALLLEVLIILLFLVLKGISVSTRNRRENLEKSTVELFKLVFIFPILWLVTTILLVLFSYFITDFNINFYMSIGYIFLIFIIDCILYVNLVGNEELKNALDRMSKNIIKNIEILGFLMIIGISILTPLLYYFIQGFNLSSYVFIGGYLIIITDGLLFVELWGKEEFKEEIKEKSDSFMMHIRKINRITLTVIILLIISLTIMIPAFLKLYNEVFFIAPSVLLMGSFSIEEPLQSTDNADILTFIVKETGLTYSKNYISLDKFNAENNSLTNIDNIILPIEPESKNKSMFGNLSDKGVWYLNINSSRLDSGNYMLHAEVTNDLSINSTFGVFRKRSDKLFNIALNSKRNHSSP
ncbi:MAG: hypothetical protein PHU34_03395 [Candidatus Methanoperedens sp.]|nr:hypothetical protein [Candidatus Methanoperedens sp.]